MRCFNYPFVFFHLKHHILFSANRILFSKLACKSPTPTKRYSETDYQTINASEARKPVIRTFYDANDTERNK